MSACLYGPFYFLNLKSTGEMFLLNLAPKFISLLHFAYFLIPKYCLIKSLHYGFLWQACIYLLIMTKYTLKNSLISRYRYYFNLLNSELFISPFRKINDSVTKLLFLVSVSDISSPLGAVYIYQIHILSKEKYCYQYSSL